ncbi:MAG: CBS domain-containing protein [Gammaproteobacteria bacterium]|nr:CBS domain-containing protein [Gammaproteobacteria bacterium]
MTGHRRITASDVMNTQFVEMDGLQTAMDAITTMRSRNVDVIMVQRRDEHDAHGILLLADIAKKVLARDRAPERVNIYEIMSKPVVSVPPGMDVRYCARLFDRFGLSVVPVIDDDKVIGIVRYHELVLDGLFKLYEA